MKEIKVPLKLDRLDDDRVVFCGVDTAQVTRENLFGTVEGEINWPAVFLPRTAWDEFGCPTVLMLTLALAEVTT